MPTISHPFRPGQANSGMTANVWGCCSKPADEHPEWVPGEAATIELKRDVRTMIEVEGRIVSHTFPKGTVLVAERDAYEPLYVIDEWAADDAERLTFVTMPGWHWATGERLSVGIPWHHAREV